MVLVPELSAFVVGMHQRAELLAHQGDLGLIQQVEPRQITLVVIEPDLFLRKRPFLTEFASELRSDQVVL